MEFESISHKRNEYINGTSDMKESISKYLKHYKWFILSAIVFFLIALIYVQFQIPQYRIETTLDDRVDLIIKELIAISKLALRSSIVPISDTAVSY